MTISNVTFPTDLLLRRKRSDMAGFNFYVERKWWIFYDETHQGFEPTTRRYDIPKNFGTDFSSVPGLFRSLASKVDSIEGSTVHDHAYRFKVLPRRTADALFREIMIAAGKSWFKRNLMWLGVRAGGWWTYREGRPRRVDGA
ncbi:MAG: DUF1353 domain-containing protein [Acidobacteriota bacterium]